MKICDVVKSKKQCSGSYIYIAKICTLSKCTYTKFNNGLKF